MFAKDVIIPHRYVLNRHQRHNVWHRTNISVVLANLFTILFCSFILFCYSHHIKINGFFFVCQLFVSAVSGDIVCQWVHLIVRTNMNLASFFSFSCWLTGTYTQNMTLQAIKWYYFNQISFSRTCFFLPLDSINCLTIIIISSLFFSLSHISIAADITFESFNCCFFSIMWHRWTLGTLL